MPTRSPHEPLRLSYTPLAASQGAPMIGMVPGFAHSADHLRPLADALQAHGMHPVLFDLQSDHRDLIRRNMVGLNAYHRGINHMAGEVQRETRQQFACMLGHSQGGLLVQELLQNSAERADMPAVLLAPIPLSGAWNAIGRLAARDPALLIHFLRSFVSHKTMQLFTEVNVREVFLDADAPEAIVHSTRAKLRHTSPAVLLQEMFRPFLRPRIQPSARPVLVATSPTDALFLPEEYEDLPDLYSNLQQVSVAGGHDFFIANPEETALHVAAFLRKNKIFSTVEHE